MIAEVFESLTSYVPSILQLSCWSNKTVLTHNSLFILAGGSIS